MNTTVILGAMSLVGTLVGTFTGILTSAKLTNYRLKELEKKVDKHNALVERVYCVEGQIRELQNNVKDLKKGGIK